MQFKLGSFVAEYSPMKRGLKAEQIDALAASYRVAEYSPMKRGLKANAGNQPGSSVGAVAEYSPMKRGLKGSGRQRS